MSLPSRVHKLVPIPFSQAALRFWLWKIDPHPSFVLNTDSVIGLLCAGDNHGARKAVLEESLQPSEAVYPIMPRFGTRRAAFQNTHCPGPDLAPFCSRSPTVSLSSPLGRVVVFPHLLEQISTPYASPAPYGTAHSILHIPACHMRPTRITWSMSTRNQNEPWQDIPTKQSQQIGVKSKAQWINVMEEHRLWRWRTLGSNPRSVIFHAETFSLSHYPNV